MKRAFAFFATLLLFAAPVSAQVDEESDSPFEADEPADVPEPEPEPEPKPEPTRTAEAAPVESEDDADDSRGSRPSGFSLGFGIGYDFPASLERPDTTSIRFRLPSGITLEPRVELSNARDSMDIGALETDDSATAVELTTTARFPVFGRGPMDLVGIGGASFAFALDDPEGDDNNTRAFTIAFVYGLGLEYWFGSRVCLSLQALNPIVSYSNTKTDMVVDDQTDSNLTIGAIFDPDVIALVHLFFD